MYVDKKTTIIEKEQGPLLSWIDYLCFYFGWNWTDNTQITNAEYFIKISK